MRLRYNFLSRRLLLLAKLLVGRSNCGTGRRGHTLPRPLLYFDLVKVVQRSLLR